MKRTHYCGELRRKDENLDVALCGWIHSSRDHGGLLFLDLRDREGVVQIVVSPEKKEVFKIAQSLGSEFVIEVQGQVRLRPKGTENPNLSTGEIEIDAREIEILNTSLVLPFEISEFNQASEEIRLQYRYLDLRRPSLQRNLILRHRIVQSVRSFLDKQGFLEIETPFLTKSTPEGARDFLVPSRLNPGHFYALPQSPQLFKQILMVGGMDKYYQIVRCFRDEDLRSDRQPEFTQIDLEMSFVEEEDVMGVTEKIILEAFKVLTGKETDLEFPRISYEEALNRFGSDKPDLRYEMELKDVTDDLKNSSFQIFSNAVKENGVIKALCFKGGAKLSRSEIDNLTEFVKRFGAKGLAWIKFTDAGPESSIVKFFSKEELAQVQLKLGALSGDILFFGAGAWKSVVIILGSLRVELAKRYDLIPKSGASTYKFLWVIHFPLLEWDDQEKRWSAMHHPFTSPEVENGDFLESAPEKVRARAYDIVLNGTELGGGSIRIHRKELQQRVFKILGVNEESAKEKFGFLLTALEYGAPPHGGIALGLDRMVAIFSGEDSIRDTIAFPKTQKGICMLAGSPSEVTELQLKELSLVVKKIKN
ncbi:MAG: aspartate--tRNA ligase [Elusimicrobia bacterium RIFCSPLOWO2_02_FULL_39_32]|nr:MAG: aspartate--tRNA ligase [Elusimicrobia bacterium GWA2_38_7]OGR81210.1 MAG: aspartate--tRNA ligase [Elusimicrobia bacterium RIFCSPHIGHO2_02_FULL_39_36]OGR91762.1 MAG: aspartate--tRNA ligase [Elusimicrobia bacterium RIFCSPLOWO2_02_FULL_39_32]OGR98422.1 MAG: aspartate--tRNA ligase [Elusimicrobia bacterium RIFCSPLOWO2_12_FULL_39_28]